MQLLRRMLLPILLLLLPSAAAATGASGYVADYGYTETSPLVVGAADNLWPYSFTDEGGRPKGLEIDVMERLLDRLGIAYCFETMNRGKLDQALQDSTIRLCVGETDSFGKSIHSSKSIVSLVSYGVAFPKGKPHVETMADVASQRVSVDEQSHIFAELSGRGWDSNIDPSSDMRESLYGISSNNSGQMIGNALSLEWLKKTNRLDNIEIQRLDTRQGKRRFIGSDSLLITSLDSIYSIMSKDGELEDLYTKWIYPDVRSNVSLFQRYALPVLSLLGVVLLGLLAWMFYRHREQKAIGDLRVQNKRLALILQTVEADVWTYDIDNHSITWYGHGDGRPRQRNLSDLENHLGKQNGIDVKAAIERLSAGNSKRESLRVLVTDDEGKRHVAEMNIGVLKTHPDGRPSQLITIQHDISKETKLQEEEAQVGQRYKQIFSESLIDLTLYDKEGKLIDVNKKAAENFNVSDVKALMSHGTHVNDVPGYEDFPNIDCENIHLVTYNEARDIETLKQTMPEMTLDEPFYYSLSLITIRDEKGETIGFCMRGNDITEWVKTSKQLIKNAKTIEAAGKATASIIEKANYALRVSGLKLFTYEPSDKTFHVYNSMNEISSQYTREQFVELVNEKYRAKLTDMLDRAERRENFSFDITLRLNKNNKDGLPLYVRMNGVPQANRDGELENYFGSYSDISEMADQRHQLEKRRSEALGEERKMTDFLRNMSYEIRTPLNNVVGFSELFTHADSKDDEHKFVKIIKSSAFHLLDLINNVLTLARIDAGMSQPLLRTADVAKQFGEWCRAGWTESDKPVELIVKEGQPLKLNIDTTMISTIIHHIVENAEENTDKGSVECSYDYSDGRLNITVADTGRGISQEALPDIFKRFGSNNNSTSAGLGLSVCKAMAELMNGEIKITSAADAGTTVSVSVPCQPPTEETPRT